MKAVMVMFDSLNRNYLPNYGCDWIQAPNFQRLGKKAVTFDNCYASSLPCIPARRELHTGRANFLHRSWGPIEPFDDSMPEILKNSGTHTHLVSDHGHYWEDGGATYHTRYSTWEIVRGQEGDPWKGQVKDPDMPANIIQRGKGEPWFDEAMIRQNWVNRNYIDKEEKYPQTVTFSKGLEFIETNKSEDNWFIQIETFDPHEPFLVPQKYKDLYGKNNDGDHFEWPPYTPANETKEEIEKFRYQYASIVSMCDEYLGKVLDIMDENDMWKDTMLIINTDHGFLLGEHKWWGKNNMPVYNEIAHIPLFIWDPRIGIKNVRRNSLVQTLDIAPTLLEYFNVEIPSSMEGQPLKNLIETDNPIRKAALFGYHGSHVNCTDGRYVYMRAPVNKENKPLYEYTLMPTHMNKMFSPKELQNIELADSFDFTKGCKTLKIEASLLINPFNYGTKLFDLEKDPKQLNPIDDLTIETRMTNYIADLMRKNNAPDEQYERIGIQKEGEIAVEDLKEYKRIVEEQKDIKFDFYAVIDDEAKYTLFALMNLIPFEERTLLLSDFSGAVKVSGINEVKEDFVVQFAKNVIPENIKPKIVEYLKIANGRN